MSGTGFFNIQWDDNTKRAIKIVGLVLFVLLIVHIILHFRRKPKNRATTVLGRLTNQTDLSCQVTYNQPVGAAIESVLSNSVKAADTTLFITIQGINTRNVTRDEHKHFHHGFSVTIQAHSPNGEFLSVDTTRKSTVDAKSPLVMWTTERNDTLIDVWTLQFYKDVPNVCVLGVVLDGQTYYLTKVVNDWKDLRPRVSENDVVRYYNGLLETQMPANPYSAYGNFYLNKPFGKRNQEPYDDKEILHRLQAT